MILTQNQIQQAIKNYFIGKPVKKAWLFGSYARGEADEDSDVDVLIAFEENASIGLQYYGWREELCELLDKKVDIVSAGWENKFIKPFIEADKLLIYEKKI